MKRLVVAMSGASGAQLGVALLETMRDHKDWETHLVISKGAERTLYLETDYSLEYVYSLASCVHPIEDIGASIASGSFQSEGMVIIPCSMKTLAGIATGYSDNLILRSADVMLKEKRRLVLVARETPLSPIHLQNMLSVAQLGGVILPPVLTFYNHPRKLQDHTMHIVAKTLSCFGIEVVGFKRWGESGLKG